MESTSIGKSHDLLLVGWCQDLQSPVIHIILDYYLDWELLLAETLFFFHLCRNIARMPQLFGEKCW